MSSRIYSKLAGGIAGLLSSTLLNLVVLPALAERFGGPGRRAPART